MDRNKTNQRNKASDAGGRTTRLVSTKDIKVSVQWNIYAGERLNDFAIGRPGYYMAKYRNTKR